jgi:hypothetical protein
MADVVGEVAPTGGGTVDQVAGAVSTATTPVTQATGGAVDTATNVSSSPPLAPVSEAATAAVETATNTASNAAPAPVTGAADSAANAVTETAASATPGAAQPVAPTSDAAAAAAGPSAEPASGVAGSTPQSAVDGVAGTVSGPGQAVHDSAVLNASDHATAGVHPAAAADPLLGASAPQGSGATAAAMDPSLTAAPHDSVLHAVAEISPAARVFVSAAIISSVVGASAAAGEKGGMRRLAFVNARLIPCLVKVSVERQLETIGTALSRAGGAAHMAGGTGSSAGEVRAESRVQRLLDDVSQGFHDVVDGSMPDVATDGDGSSGLKDTTLMTRIGIVLGLVYVGFLSIWFWATRRRQEEGR